MTTTTFYRCPCGATENTTPRGTCRSCGSDVARLVTETEDHEEDHEVLHTTTEDTTMTTTTTTGHSARVILRNDRTHIAFCDTCGFTEYHEHSVYARDAAMRHGRDATEDTTMTTTPDILRHAVLRTGPHQANSEPREPREALCGRMATRYVSSRALGVTCEACRHEMDVVRSAAIAAPEEDSVVLHTTTEDTTMTTETDAAAEDCMRCLTGTATVGRYCAECIPAVVAIIVDTHASLIAERTHNMPPRAEALAEEHTAWNRYQAAILAGEDRRTHDAWHAWEDTRVVLDAIDGSAQLPGSPGQIAMYNRACRRADCDVRWNRHGVSARCERAAVIAGRIAVAGGAAAARCWDGDCQTT